METFKVGDEVCHIDSEDPKYKDKTGTIIRTGVTVRWPHGDVVHPPKNLRKISPKSKEVEHLKAELAAAYIELRKQRPCIHTMYDYEVWCRAADQYARIRHP